MRSNRMRTGIQGGECAEITSANETLAKLNLGLEAWLIVLVDRSLLSMGFSFDCRARRGPIGMNPGLAKALGVMMKLDFQRAVLNPDE